MKIKSFSKINLFLNVNKKLKSKKLHDIQTFFCLVNIFDQIIIKKIKGKKDKISFKGVFAKHIDKNNNSIKNSLDILRNREVIKSYYSIVVNKKIPVFSGMGGGTSNAYFLVKYLLDKKISNEVSKELEKKIGTDFKLFFQKQGFLENLKKLKNIKNRHKLYFLLVYPNLQCSTRYVYSKIKTYSPKCKYNSKTIVKKSVFLNSMKNKKNDLQIVIEKRYPKIRKLISEIGLKKGCYFSRMTGSGSVCFGVFKTLKNAKIALKIIKSKYPSYWVTVAKTI